MTFYGRRKSEDHQLFKFPILCIVIITQSNVLQTAFNVLHILREEGDKFLDTSWVKKNKLGMEGHCSLTIKARILVSASFNREHVGQVQR